MDAFTKDQADVMYATLQTLRDFTYFASCEGRFVHCSNGVKDKDEIDVDCGGVDCDVCPIIGNPSSGGIGNYDFDEVNCIVNLSTNGFLIDGQDDLLVNVCLDNGISISPGNILSCNNTRFRFKEAHASKWGTCPNNPNPIKCFRNPLLSFFKCACDYRQMLFDVTEVDKNLNIIGQEISEWKNISKEDSKNSHGNSFSLLNYLPKNTVLIPGKYYKLKLAIVDNFDLWIEGTKYIRISNTNIHINNENITTNLNGLDIIIENSTVSVPIDVIAGNQIDIKGTTHLTAGHYFTDPTLSCGSFTGKKSMVQFNPNNNIAAEQNEVSYNENPTNTTSQQGSISNPTLPPQNIKIYPNPSRGIFVVELGEGAYNQIQIIDFLGRQVYSRQILGNRMEIDISNFSKGLYSVLITNEQGGVYSQKVVKN